MLLFRCSARLRCCKSAIVKTESTKESNKETFKVTPWKNSKTFYWRDFPLFGFCWIQQVLEFWLNVKNYDQESDLPSSTWAILRRHISLLRGKEILGENQETNLKEKPSVKSVTNVTQASASPPPLHGTNKKNQKLTYSGDSHCILSPFRKCTWFN